jgi:hypothetical protein
MPSWTAKMICWCAVRLGNVHSAHGWREVLDPVVRYRGQTLRLLCGDAAFALPDVYEYLESEGFEYAIRLPANAVLQERIAPLLTRHVGGPRYYAGASRVAKVEWDPGELYPRVGPRLEPPFLAIVCLNVALARALRALDVATLGEDARRYLRCMEFLATPPEASDAGGTPLPERALTPDPEGEAWMRLYWEVPPQQRTRLLTMARAAADVLRE